MTEELKAAIERAKLRRAGIEVSTDDDYHDPTACFIDDGLIADAYLAEHPADDFEPVTADWLNGWGFGSHEGYSKDVLVALIGNHELSWRPGQRSNHNWWLDGVTYEGHPVPLGPTRGHARKFFEAVGLTRPTS